jgi:SulP family sulfate permease
LFVPKLFTTLKSYDRDQFFGDLTAGVIVGIVALPLAIAFAIASGVSPDRGLWTAIVAGLVISALGGSRVQIGGPTGAFIVIVYGIVQKYGIDGLTVATFMAGAILVVMGIAKLGNSIKFIPHPVITGFTSGIAVIIFSGEIKDLLGLRMGSVPSEFLPKWQSLIENIGTFSPAAAGIAALSFGILWLWPKINRRIPAPFIVLLVATVVVQLSSVPVETIGSRFGAISAAVPHPQLPHLSLIAATSLVGPAFTIAFLAAVESLLSAVIADGMIGSRHRPNMELVAQGIANLVSPLFGGIPATGAIARTATNVKNGGRTPVAGIVHALTLLVITLFVGKWVALVPLASLAAILVVVAYHMSEWSTFVAEMRSPRSDVAVLLTTFALTLLVDLTVGISVGMVLAAFLFIRRMSEVTNVRAVTEQLAAGLSFNAAGELEESDDPYEVDVNAIRRYDIPAGVEVYEIFGPLFFGAAETFRDTLAFVARKPKVLVIRMRHVLALDSTGMHALQDLVHRSRKEGIVVLLSDVHMQPLVALTGTPLLTELGQENLFSNLDDALNRARSLLGLPPAPPHKGNLPTVSREMSTGAAPEK